MKLTFSEIFCGENTFIKKDVTKNKSTKYFMIRPLVIYDMRISSHVSQTFKQKNTF